ncbi:MAG: LLM class F420-dependent oxidoreductase [Ilumatobacteraceae bacterium]
MTNRTLVRAALQMPTFHGLGVPDDGLFEHLSSYTQSAENAGFDTVFVMDHFYQLVFLGGSRQPMLEGYMLLSALAARTRRVNLGTLVTGVTYRNPAMLGKMITTLDVVSRGRAICGIGAAWYEEEHRAFGFDFPATARRFEMLDEAVQILRGMFTQAETTVTGRHFRSEGLVNVPAPLRTGGPPILIGGSGERKTIPLAARVADAINFNCTVDEVPHKLTVLHRALEAAGRSRDSINVTLLASLVTASTEKEVDDLLRRMVAGRGMDPAQLDDPGFRTGLTARMIVGTHAEVADRLGGLCGESGLDGLSFMLPAHAADPDGPAAVAPALRECGLIVG